MLSAELSVPSPSSSIITKDVLRVGVQRATLFGRSSAISAAIVFARLVIVLGNLAILARENPVLLFPFVLAFADRVFAASITIATFSPKDAPDQVVQVQCVDSAGNCETYMQKMNTTAASTRTQTNCNANPVSNTIPSSELLPYGDTSCDYDDPTFNFRSDVKIKTSIYGGATAASLSGCALTEYKNDCVPTGDATMRTVFFILALVMLTVAVCGCTYGLYKLLKCCGCWSSDSPDSSDTEAAAPIHPASTEKSSTRTGWFSRLWTRDSEREDAEASDARIGGVSRRGRGYGTGSKR